MTREPGARLGRGLSALLGEATNQTGDAPLVRMLSIEDIGASPFQPRMTMAAESLAELVESVKSQGILQPVLVRPARGGASPRYELIAGERRWRAAQEAGLHEIPALVRPLSDTDAMAAALVENLQRQDLNPIEEAEGYKRLLEEFGLTQERLGLAVGKSRSHVANVMRLLQLPQSVRHELQTGALSAGHARALLGHPAPEKALVAVLARGLNVRQTEALASQSRNPRSRSAPADPDTVALARRLSLALGLDVRLLPAGTGGTVQIKYRDLDQLDGLVRLLSPNNNG